MPNGDEFTRQGIVSRLQAQLAPTFRQGAQAVRQAAAGAARRRGIFGAADIARQATEPFGQQLGRAAAQAGVAGERIAADIEKQRRSLELAREELAQRKAMEEARLAEMQASRQQQLQMQLFPHTGFTPQLLERAGFGGEGGFFGGPGAFRGFQRELGRLGLPGLPFGGGGMGGGIGRPFGGASSALQLQRMFPGMSRGGRMQMAMNLGLIPGAIQPGQFQR